MKKVDFYSDIKEVLMIEASEVNENTPVQLTSLTTLAVMAFIDEHFNKQVKTADLKNINKISDLIGLIGPENLQ
ncbi:MAG TPA: hypothetical protein PLR88_00045 [Bacteroidales bacterium]|nr:hypothetical protein [Bacteroidales bacterium]HPT20304.1 hypothetical protein [Bacteroidales bacterium]